MAKKSIEFVARQNLLKK